MGLLMKLTYLYHSGFLLETEHYYLLLDYFLDGYAPESVHVDKGGLVRAIGPLGSSELIVQDELETLEALEITAPKACYPGVIGSLWPKLNKPCYILCSHYHKDHFLPFVLELFKYAAKRRSQDSSFPQVNLIFSSDIKKYRSKRCAPYKDEICFLQKGQCYEDDFIKVQAHGSTDVGSSFAISLKDEELNVFHAGDFNYWHWQEESTQEEITKSHEFFLSELEPIVKSHPSFDVIMFPCDMRMVSDICAGAAQFCQRINCRLLVPMHVIERPDLVLSALYDNELLQSAIVHYEPAKRINELKLSSQLQVWLPENSGDSCNIFN